MNVRIIPFAVLCSLIACTQQSEIPSAAAPGLSDEEMIKRGEYVVSISGCNDCHSPKVMTAMGPEPDTSRLLSGHPASEQLPPVSYKGGWVLFSMGQTATVGPWGISFAANLTPHETGIGNWSYDQFEVAIRQGKYRGLPNGRPLLPPMPWQVYRNMTEDDLRSVFAYLKSLPPVNNTVPATVTPPQMAALSQ